MRHLDRRFLPVCFTLLLVMTAACNRSTSTTGTTTAAVKVTDVTLGRAIGGDKTITDKTEDFRPNDTIYASIATDGAAAVALRAKWTYADGQVVDDSTRNIAPNTRERTEFHVAKPGGWPTGKYQVEIFLNGTSAETKKFEVK